MTPVFVIIYCNLLSHPGRYHLSCVRITNNSHNSINTIIFSLKLIMAVHIFLLSPFTWWNVPKLPMWPSCFCCLRNSGSIFFSPSGMCIEAHSILSSSFELHPHPFPSLLNLKCFQNPKIVFKILR